MEITKVVAKLQISFLTLAKTYPNLPCTISTRLKTVSADLLREVPLLVSMVVHARDSALIHRQN